MSGVKFEWGYDKDRENQLKHGVAFEAAKYAFADPLRVIAEDTAHSGKEKSYYCFGKVTSAIMTVRFTYRAKVIRIFGAGYWRKGRKIYEEKNKIY
ncbi:MAG: BrnT family toxin [Elusimicrobiota bacterium]|nr:BrnT family toxin [Elusimicrobiota bacterium]